MYSNMAVLFIERKILFHLWYMCRCLPPSRIFRICSPATALITRWLVFFNIIFAYIFLRWPDDGNATRNNFKKYIQVCIGSNRYISRNIVFSSYTYGCAKYSWHGINFISLKFGLFHQIRIFFSRNTCHIL